MISGKITKLSCPSAQLEADGAEIIGVVFHGEETEVHYLEKPVLASEQLLSALGDVRPDAIFRVAAPCAEERCIHHGDGRCGLVDRVVQRLPGKVTALPKCSMRKSCVWFHQRGIDACNRCSLLATWNASPSDTLLEVTTP